MAISYMLLLTGNRLERYNHDGTYNTTMDVPTPGDAATTSLIDTGAGTHWQADCGICLTNGKPVLCNDGGNNYPHIARVYNSALTALDSEYGPATTDDSTGLYIIGVGAGTSIARVGTNLHRVVWGQDGTSYTDAAIVVADTSGTITATYFPAGCRSQLCSVSDDETLNHTIAHEQADAVISGVHHQQVGLINYLHPTAAATITLTEWATPTTGTYAANGRIAALAGDKTTNRLAIVASRLVDLGAGVLRHQARLLLYDPADTTTPTLELTHADIAAAYPTLAGLEAINVAADYDAERTLWISMVAEPVSANQTFLLRLDDTGTFLPAINVDTTSGYTENGDRTCLFRQDAPVAAASRQAARVFRYHNH